MTLISQQFAESAPLDSLFPHLLSDPLPDSGRFGRTDGFTVTLTLFPNNRTATLAPWREPEQSPVDARSPSSVNAATGALLGSQPPISALAVVSLPFGETAAFGASQGRPSGVQIVSLAFSETNGLIGSDPSHISEVQSFSALFPDTGLHFSALPLLTFPFAQSWAVAATRARFSAVLGEASALADTGEFAGTATMITIPGEVQTPSSILAATRGLLGTPPRVSALAVVSLALGASQRLSPDTNGLIGSNCYHRSEVYSLSALFPDTGLPFSALPLVTFSFAQSWAVAATQARLSAVLGLSSAVADTGELAATRGLLGTPPRVSALAVVSLVLGASQRLSAHTNGLIGTADYDSGQPFQSLGLGYTSPFGGTQPRVSVDQPQSVLLAITGAWTGTRAIAPSSLPSASWRQALSDLFYLDSPVFLSSDSFVCSGEAPATLEAQRSRGPLSTVVLAPSSFDRVSDVNAASDAHFLSDQIPASAAIGLTPPLIASLSILFSQINLPSFAYALTGKSGSSAKIRVTEVISVRSFYLHQSDRYKPSTPWHFSRALSISLSHLNSHGFRSSPTFRWTAKFSSGATVVPVPPPPPSVASASHPFILSTQFGHSAAPSSAIQTEKGNSVTSKATSLAIGASLAALVLIVTALLILLFLKRRQKEETEVFTDSPSEMETEPEDEMDSFVDQNAFIEWENPLGPENAGATADRLSDDADMWDDDHSEGGTLPLRALE
jgi:hypothetical protein